MKAVPVRWICFPAVWLTVLMMSSWLLPVRLDRVRNNFDIGHADGVAYAWQARNLVAGKGWRIPYVTNFYHVYPPGEDRIDDQWGPLLSFALVPGFHRYGPEPNVARMTTVVIGTLLVPLALCMLVQALTLQAWPGLFAPIPVWVSTALMRDSLDLNADQLLSAVLCLFLAALLASRRHRGFLLLCGPLMALAWYGKGSQIILFPFFLGAVLLLHGPRICLRAPFLGAVLLALLCMSPRLRENVRDHGKPLHSTQSPVSAFFGLSPSTWTQWDQGFYSIHWGRELPTLRNRFDHPALHAHSIRRNRAEVFRQILAGLDAPAADWPEPDWTERRAETLRRLPRSRWPMLAGLLLGGVALLNAPLHWGVRLIRRKPYAVSFADPPAVLFAFVLMQGLFIVLFWEAIPRLVFPVSIPALALPWILLPPLPKRWRFPTWAVCLLTFLACAAFALNLHPRVDAVIAEQESTFRRPPPGRPVYPRVKQLGDLLAERLPPDAVLMSRRQWQTLWYAPETFRSIGIPHARPPELFAVAKFYGVTHLVLDQNRPGLQNALRRHRNAFELVIERPVRVYQIHWDRLPENFLTPLEDIRPLWDARIHLRELEEALQQEL